MVAPGAIATVFGQNFANGSFEADIIPLPTELGGVRVEVNGIPAPLYFVSAGQINFQIPFETELGEATVVVFRGGVASEPETVQVKAYVPAAFRNPATGEAIVVVNGTSQLISAENKAVAGQVVTVFMNGYGTLDNPPATGAAASVDPLARTVAVPRVTLGDQEVTVYYAGLTPNLVGLGQLDLGLPAEFPESFQSTLPLNIDFDGFAAPEEDLAVDLPTPPGPDVGIEITNVNPQSIFPGGSFEVDYTLRNLSGYAGEAEVTFVLQLANSFATLASFNVELSGSDQVLSRELTTSGSMFPGSYTFYGEVEIAGDANPANDIFTVEEPFLLEAASGDPHDVGVEVTSVSPTQIAPGDTLTYEYTLLNLTEYSGPVTVTFQLSTSSFGRILLTEQVTLEGEPRELTRQVPTPEDLQLDTFRPVMRVDIENDTDPTNNLVVFREVDIVVAAAAQSTTLSQAMGEPPPIRDLTEGNLSEWQLEAYRGMLPVNPGIRLGGTAPVGGRRAPAIGGEVAPMAGESFLTGVAPTANRLILSYPRKTALEINWDLSASQSLELWLSLGSNKSLQKGNPRIILRSPGGSRILTRIGQSEQQDWTSDLSTNQFQRLSVPLKGDEDWAATTRGDFDSRKVTSFELDFQFDQPAGVTVNLDGVQFKE
jgi:uncharacterized protein (TIGR03437 family)